MPEVSMRSIAIRDARPAGGGAFLPLRLVNPEEMIVMYIPVEQRPATPARPLPPAVAVPVPPAENVAARPTEPADEPPRITEELLIEEVSIDGMCGVY